MYSFSSGKKLSLKVPLSILCLILLTSSVISVKNSENPEILIPLNALFEDNGSNVYLFKNGIAVKTAVEIGELRETNKISIVKGLKNGDKVIVAGVSKLVDGDKVKLLGGN